MVASFPPWYRVPDLNSVLSAVVCARAQVSSNYNSRGTRRYPCHCQDQVTYRVVYVYDILLAAQVRVSLSLHIFSL
jgi:hypothetical protein